MGGQDIPVMQRFEDGFVSGVHQIDPKAVVDVKYVNSFQDEDTGKKIADAEYASGADIIYTAAGKSGLGAIDSVKAQPKGKYLIGVDTDQDALAPGKILTSMVKHVDVAVYDIAKAVNAHHPLMGHVVLGLQDQALSLTDFKYTWDVVGPEKVARLNRLQTAVVNGQIKVPDSRVALAHWRPSAF
jgi:basic membrane protein A